MHSRCPIASFPDIYSHIRGRIIEIVAIHEPYSIIGDRNNSAITDGKNTFLGKLLHMFAHVLKRFDRPQLGDIRKCGQLRALTVNDKIKKTIG